MEIFIWADAQQLDSYLAAGARPELLQSWFWGEVMSAEGDQVLRLGVRENGQVLAAASLAVRSLGLGWSYLISPRGPIISDQTRTAEIMAVLCSHLASLFPKALFWRIEPAVLPGQTVGKYAIRKTVNLEPAETLALDLEQDEEKLLAAMHPKTRYNIRLAEKKGVTVREIASPSEGDWQEFRRLMSLTGSRDGFRLHSSAHYENLVRYSGGAIRMYLASYEGKGIAGGLFAFWNGQAAYLHGASDNEYRSVMAPHLLQWTAIREAGKRGCQRYDFYGIDEEKWPGVTRFKLGFGGERVSYPGTFDLVFRPSAYKLYGLIRHLRRQIAR